MIWQFVKNFASIVTFALSITDTNWTLADAWVKRTNNSKNNFLNVRPFSPGGFFTFLAVVALGAALLKQVTMRTDGVAIYFLFLSMSVNKNCFK